MEEIHNIRTEVPDQYEGYDKGMYENEKYPTLSEYRSKACSISTTRENQGKIIAVFCRFADKRKSSRSACESKADKSGEATNNSTARRYYASTGRNCPITLGIYFDTGKNEWQYKEDQNTRLGTAYKNRDIQNINRKIFQISVDYLDNPGRSISLYWNSSIYEKANNSGTCSISCAKRKHITVDIEQ